MDVALKKIKQDIISAKQAEAHEGKMSAYIDDNLSTLHDAISISSNTPNPVLMKFVIGYVDSAIEYLEAFNALTKEAKLEGYMKPFLNLACAYFIDPPGAVKPFEELRGMLYKAYLSNRLLEEVNDQIMSLTSIPLAPVDMSMTNIVSHALIGDELANQLDHLVLLSVETTESDKKVFEQEEVKFLIEKRKIEGWDDILKRWPCFTKNFSGDLQIGNY